MHAIASGQAITLSNGIFILWILWQFVYLILITSPVWILTNNAKYQVVIKDNCWSVMFSRHVKKTSRGQAELNHRPLDLQSNALPLSYTPFKLNLFKAAPIYHVHEILLSYWFTVLQHEAPTKLFRCLKENQGNTIRTIHKRLHAVI